ncbi:MAG: methyltransferase domain-containing protein, partial [Acidobacteria bacterium]|nr:methyltransferase domain-containing protein [Acidobacteriota bacterium]
MQLHLGFAPSRIISSALELGIFSQLANGGMTAAETARACRATERGTRMLLDSLVGLELLAKSGENYILTPPAAQYLNPESPDFIGELLSLERLWQSWSRLTEVVRSGRVEHPVEDQREAEAFFPHLIRGLHVANREPARRTAETLGAGLTRRALRVLDVACGSGIWGIAVAEADSQARVMAQDFPGVLDETRKYVKRHGLEERFEYLPGNLKQVQYGEGRYDIALLGNIVHSAGEQSPR